MTDDAPTPEQRRRAVCHAVAAAPGLMRYATRFTITLADAEDAYQRSMEIALLRAPTVDPARFRAWLHTVLRNEALAVTRERHREGPMASDDAALVADQHVEADVDTPAMAEWRERYLILAEALAGISEAQRVCLMLRAAGASYRDIEDLTGFTNRKVERSVLEGRAALTRLEQAISDGEVCHTMEGLIDRIVDGRADAAERRRVARHVRRCRACRSVLRARMDTNDGLAAFVPLVLLGGVAGHAAPPDPGPALAWMERISAGATFRMGNVMQVVMDVPGSVAAKVGAGAAVAAIAGTAGLPVMTGSAGRPAPTVVQVPIAATAEALTKLAVPPAVAQMRTASRPSPRPRRAHASREAARTPSPPRPRPATAAGGSTHATVTPARVAVARRARSVSVPTARPAPAPPGRSADIAGARGISLGP